ncbi:MAG: ABC-type transport auxiliary lipoprotein family protein [Pseudomonadota bacterium]|nr:ABC-type transport auxiliary lipoprotein family protein [Pseudomonadota bacterium]
MGYFALVRASILDRFRIARRRRLFPVLLAGLSFVLLAACSSAPVATYDLTPAGSGFAARAGRGQLAVLRPEATLPADSDRIVVRTNLQSVAYLSGAQWADKLPTLVQSRLIESFQNARLLRAVGRPGMLADFSLQTSIRRFELDAARSEAVVEISAQILGPSGRIVGGRLFAANVPAPSSDPAVVTSALDAALAQVMREIVIWTAPRI